MQNKIFFEKVDKNCPNVINTGPQVLDPGTNLIHLKDFGALYPNPNSEILHQTRFLGY